MVPAWIDGGSEAETGAPDSMDDNPAFEGCEGYADEEFYVCCEVAYPSVATLLCDEKFNKQCVRFGLDPGLARDLRTGHDLNTTSEKDEARVPVALLFPQ